MKACLAALWLLACWQPQGWAAAPAEGDDAGAVADLGEAQDPGDLSDQEWRSVEARLGGPEQAQALAAWLAKYPKGPRAARAHWAKGLKLENLEEARAAFREAVVQDPQGSWGRLARLELGRLEYALGNPEAALTHLEGVGDTLAAGRPEALFWRAQARMALKGLSRAQDDFEAFLKEFPDHPLADSAQLSVADCDALLKNHDAALKGYQRLYEAPDSSVAPQALWQAGSLQLLLGHKDEARALYQRLADGYPDSFEAPRAHDRLAALPLSKTAPGPLAKAGKKQGYTVQVGAFSRRVSAEQLYKTLKKRRYAVRIDKRVLGDDVFHVVQVGRFKTKAQADKILGQLARRDKIRGRVVEQAQP